MRPDAVTISRRARHGYSEVNPSLILDVGFRTKASSLDLHAKFPQARILSHQYDPSNFLADKTYLAYHDRITFKSFDPSSFSFHLDQLAFANVERWGEVDFINLDVQGLEKNIFRSGGNWPDTVKFIKARLGEDYDYRDAKNDLRQLGYKANAMYDNSWFYVVGTK